jgi:hypothetical protein
MSLSCTKQLQNPNPSLYDENLWEVAKGQCLYARTREAAIVQSLAGSISTISSILIIYIIFISPTKLSSIYHRIILGLSITEILFDVSYALATLPMPSPGDYWTDSYNVQGTRLGNTYTCTAQGFFFTFGSISSYLYHCFSLTVYYLCSIGFKMKTETMVKYVEPMLHALPISAGLLLALPPLFQGQYNASNEWQWCDIGPKPWFCNEDNNGIECIRGQSTSSMLVTRAEYDHVNSKYFIVYSAIAMLDCLILGAVCWRVYREEACITSLVIEQNVSTARSREYNEQEEMVSSSVPENCRSLTPQLNKTATNKQLVGADLSLYQIGDGSLFTMEEVVRVAKDQYKETKIIAEQSMMYILAALIIPFCWCIALSLQETSIVSRSVLSALMYLEGFYTLLIFTFHKVHNMKRCNTDISTSEAIIRIFKHGEGGDSFVLTRMDMVYPSANDDDGFDDDDDDDTSTRREDALMDQEIKQPFKRKTVLPVSSLSSRLKSEQMVANANYGAITSFTVPSQTSSGDVGSRVPSQASGNAGSSSSFGSLFSGLLSNVRSYASKEDDKDEDLSFSSSLLSHGHIYKSHQSSSIVASIREENFDTHLQALYKEYDKDNKEQESNN